MVVANMCVEFFSEFLIKVNLWFCLCSFSFILAQL